MDSARSPGRSTMHTGSGIYLVVEMDDGTKYGMGVGMSCARGQSGRSRRAVRMPRLSVPRLSRPQSHSRPLLVVLVAMPRFSRTQSQSHPRPLLVL